MSGLLTRTADPNLLQYDRLIAPPFGCLRHCFGSCASAQFDVENGATLLMASKAKIEHDTAIN